jgi:hypothetical protein
MKATELRVGNLVLNKIDNSILEISAKDILFLEEGGDEFVFEPIPLTEEWSLKLGYLSMNNKTNYRMQGHEIWKCNDLSMRDKSGKILKYVHRLQNLFFELTDKELIIQS